MELRQLEYFQVVSRLNSITRAATQLHITQPSISVAIRKLEEELGIKLFNRHKKQLTLTHAGHIYLQRVEDILNRVQDSVAEMNDYKNFPKDAIRIGVTPMIGTFLFPYIFTRFKQLYPHVHMNIVEEGTLAVRSLLEQGELDVGVIIISDISPCLETSLIITGQILACLPLNHALSKLTNISFSQLKNQPFILFKEDTFSRQMILAQCAKHQFAPNVIISSSQIETIVRLVEQGAGITFLLDAIARNHIQISSHPLADPLFIQAGLAWNKERYLSNAAKAFIKVVKDFPAI